MSTRGAAWVLVAVAAACGGGGNGDDVTGPYTGDVHRFVVDAIGLARDGTEVQAVADDLDGNGVAENKLGVITELLASTDDLSIDAGDMIAAGALASVVELQADDLADDPTVAVRYLGADGDDATIAGGTLVAGAFRSNRSASTRVPGRARARLPIYTNADPLALPLEGVELDLDPDGHGGFDGVVRGGILDADVRAQATAGLVQMFADEPARHLVFERGVDVDRDGVLSASELADSTITILTTPDVRLFAGARYAPDPTAADKDALSAAFTIHLRPCAAGRCATVAPANTCRDRVRDGDETDVDCGGSCQACADAAACGGAADCRSRACDAGHCRAATCNDGVLDGFESDVDCGGACGTCAPGKACAVTADCATACDATNHCAP